MNNIPTIEELRELGNVASLMRGRTDDPVDVLITAIRDAVVAACRPQLRPIAEMPEEMPEGCVRLFGFFDEGWKMSQRRVKNDTHFIDIVLPVEAYPADFERAFDESGLDAKDKDAAFKLWKGGAR